ncbi:MAG: aminotransferase class V-fold PLP-dependent enzyme [Actinobacteria bacterium]|nr:aminotransferase class V-fold PLP-dependent enzyme [Actinomycetota bacterium]
MTKTYVVPSQNWWIHQRHTYRVKISLPAPRRLMASDNAAGVHPSILDAINKANSFHALGYGHDKFTSQAKQLFNQLFDAETVTEFVFGGTGANVLALACMLKPAQAVVCTSTAHIAVDEAGAPERFLGAKLIDIPTVDGKLRPSDINSVMHLRDSIHHAEPAVVSITQATEMGTIYTADEVRQICETAHELGMLVHMDGARITNAAVALGATPAALRSFTKDAGVDVLSFGGVKAGLMFGEAVVFFNTSLATRVEYIRKQVAQLNSKMRFVSAQYVELLQNDLLFNLAKNANAMALALYDQTRHHKSLNLTTPPSVNSLFPTIQEPAASALREWTFFWDWDEPKHQYRWMTAWDTTLEDVSSFAEGVSQALKI